MEIAVNYVPVQSIPLTTLSENFYIFWGNFGKGQSKSLFTLFEEIFSKPWFRRQVCPVCCKKIISPLLI